MQLGGILQRLKTEGVLLTYIDFRSGTFHDWSENSRNAVAPASNGSFTKKGLQTSSGYSTITSDATLQAATTGTLIIRQKLTAAVTPLADKGTQFGWAYDPIFGYYQFVGGGVTVTLNRAGAGTFTHAVEFDSAGGTPKGYLDGALLGNYTGGVTVAGSATNIHLGYLYVTSAFTNTEYFLFISRKLTAAEHSEIYTYLQSVNWPSKVYSPIARPFTYSTKDTALVRNISGPIREGKILDKTGNASLTSYVKSSNMRTLNGPLSFRLTPQGQCVAYNYLGSYPTVNGSSYTISCLIKDVPLSGDNMILYSGTTPEWLLAGSGATLLFQTSDGGNGRHTVNLNNTNTHFVSVKVNPATPSIAISIDGVPYNSGWTAGSIYAYGGLTGLLLGGRVLLDASALNGSAGIVGIFSDLKTDTWVRQQWVNVAQAAQFKTDWGCKESLANESTVGAFVGNGSTPFEILSGEWKLNDSVQYGELTKSIECVSAGTLWLDRKFMNINSSEAAYGSWQLRLYHPNGANSYVGLVCSSKSTFASHNGYAIKMDVNNTRGVIRHAAAVETAVVGLPVGETNHVCRRFDNVWSGYSRYEAGFMIFWNDVGYTWTDSTYTTSEGMCFTMNAGDKIGLSSVAGNNGLTKFLGEFDPKEV